MERRNEGTPMDKFGRGASLAAVVATLAIACAVAHAEGDVPPPRNARLGIAIAYLDENWRETNSYRSSGVMVVGVDPRGRAAKSGIVAGDVLVSVAGRTMREPSDLGYAERTLLSGEAVAVVLARDGGKSIKIFGISPLGATPVAPAEGVAGFAKPPPITEPVVVEPAAGAAAGAAIVEPAAPAVPEPAAPEPATSAAPQSSVADTTTSTDTTASASKSAAAPAAVAAGAVVAGAAAAKSDPASNAESTPTSAAATESPSAGAANSGGSSAGAAVLGTAAVAGAAAAKAAPNSDAPAEAAATTETASDSAAKPAASAQTTTTSTEVAPSATGAGSAAAAAVLATLGVVSSGGEGEASTTPPAETDATTEGDKPVTSDLGVRGQPLTPDFATALGASGTEGVLVLGVTAASPADRSGVRAGDIIVKVGDQPVADMDEVLKAAAASANPVKVTTVRLGKPVVALVSLDGPPPVPTEPPSQEQLLLELRDGVRSARPGAPGLRKKT